MTDEGRTSRPKQLERELRQSMVGLTKWSGETAMEPVFLLAQEGNYRAVTEALMQMVADRTVVLHRWYEHVLLRAAVAYGVDPAPLRDVQTLPDWPVLEEFGFLLDHVIDWLEDRLPEGEAEHMRETHRCGEGGMVVSWLATCIAERNIELTRAEQQAIQMLRYEADIDWFKYRVLTYTPPPRTNYAVAPGAYLQEWIDEQELSVQQAAAFLGCSSKQLGEIISGQTPITDKIAHRLAQRVGIPAESWLRYENTYRADIARIARQGNQEGMGPRSYGTSGGVELTDEVIERAADEAELGYEINCWNCRNPPRPSKDQEE